MSNAPDPHHDIAIIGAGIGGLTLALALRQRGLDAVLYERTAELREVGAAVALSANATRLLHDYGVYEQLDEVSWPQRELVFRDGPSGARIASIEVGRSYRDRLGGDYWGIHRAELQRILSGAVGMDAIRMRKGLVDISSGDDVAHLEFSDGTRATADTVVAADGARSTIRRWLVGHDDAIYSGRSGFRGIVPTEALTELPDPDSIQFWVGPRGHLLHYAIGAHGEHVNFLTVQRDVDPWPVPEWMMPSTEGDQLACFDGWHPAVGQMVTAAPVSQRWALMRRPPLRTWSKGRVVLLGDAAHALVPHHGQGANQSIEDTVVLAEELARHGSSDPRAAFAAYEARRKPRTRAVQFASYQVAEALHVPAGEPASARDAALSAEGGLEHYLGWIHDYDPRVDSGIRRR